jgi:hypothetical protein
MNKFKILSILFTAVLCFAFIGVVSAQKTNDKKTTKATPAVKQTPANDCVTATAAQINMLEKLCDEMRFASTQDAKVENDVQARAEKAKKIIGGDALEVCKLFEKVKKSKKVCGKEKEIIKQFTALYEM